MVRNKVGGNRAKKFARKNINAEQHYNKKLRVSESEDEMYAICTKMLGNSQIECMCLDGIKRHCFIRKKFTGKNKHNNLIRVGTWIMCGLRSWESSGKNGNKLEKTDLLEIYDDREKEKLIQTTNTNFVVLKKEETMLMSFDNSTTGEFDDSIQFTSAEQVNNGAEPKFGMSQIEDDLEVNDIENDDDSIDFDDI
tara:strand:- start:2289 stop:2873 length:585 start_codon:yes stop_codon:yes gene_type:complete